VPVRPDGFPDAMAQAAASHHLRAPRPVGVRRWATIALDALDGARPAVTVAAARELAVGDAEKSAGPEPGDPGPGAWLLPTSQKEAPPALVAELCKPAGAQFAAQSSAAEELPALQAAMGLVGLPKPEPPGNWLARRVRLKLLLSLVALQAVTVALLAAGLQPEAHSQLLEVLRSVERAPVAG
jgi:hypothetical protein